MNASVPRKETQNQTVVAGEENQISHVYQIIQSLTQGLVKLPTDYVLRIKNFLYEYLGSPSHPVPFGGRKAELAALDEWFSTPSAPPYALLAAEAGRGKSALLTRWAENLIACQMAHVVFIPVSIRFNTALATVTFSALAVRLAEVYGESLTSTNLSVEQWRGICQSYLNRMPPDGKPVIVILDGLDEAADWQVGTDFFPSQPPEGVRVIISARYLAGDTNESGWRRRLGWDTTQLAVSLPLPPLTPDGLRDVLRKMGNPLDQLATKIDIIGQLYRLSEGDPLLVRLYVEALLPYGERVAMITPEQLQAISPGLAGYFERWWDEQETQWQAQNRDPLGEKEEVLTFFNLCAAALGPLTRHDIAAIVGDQLASKLPLKGIAKEVERFIIGDGKKQGYTFSHPRLSYYFWEQMSHHEQASWNTRFTDFGRQTLDALNNGTLHPHKAPAYALEFYSTHLERAEAPPEAFYALVSEGWMRAWKALDGTHAGFLNDVERAWHQAESERAIAMQIKCALCRTSVMALSMNISPQLLAKVVRHNVLTPVQGLVMAQQMPSEEKQAYALSELAVLLSKSLLSQALEIAEGIPSENWRAQALNQLAPHLPDDLMDQALEITIAIQDEWSRASVLGTLAPHLPDELQAFALNEALKAAQAIPRERLRVDALSWLAPHLSDKLLAQALQATQDIQSPSFRADVLSGLAPHLPDGLLTQALTQALETANALSEPVPHLAVRVVKMLQAVFAIQNADSRTSALGKLVADLSNKLMGQALHAAQAIQSEQSRASALGTLAPHLSDELLAQALHAAQAIQDEQFRANALCGLVPHLGDELQAIGLQAVLTIQSEKHCTSALTRLAPYLSDELLAQALLAAQTIQSELSRANALSGLVPHLGDKLQAVAVVDALQAVAQSRPFGLARLDTSQAIQDDRSRADVLSRLVPHLADEQQAIALQSILAIQDEQYRASVLARLAPHLSDELITQALHATQDIQNEWHRASALVGLAPHLPNNLLTQVLEPILVIQYERSRANALGSLAPHLPNNLLTQVLETALAIQDEQSRALALNRLAPHLSDKLMAQALQATQDIQNEGYRANALSGLTPHLPNNLLAQALETTLAIQDEQSRANALSRLASYLPDEQQPSVLANVLQARLAIRDKPSRTAVFVRLAPYLSDKLLTQAIHTTQAVPKKGCYACKLRGLAPYLSDNLLAQVLDIAQATPSEKCRAKALGWLAPHLSSNLLTQALEIAQAIQSEEWRTKALNGLAPHLPSNLLTQALEIAQAIQSEEWRAKALDRLAPHLTDKLLAQAVHIAQAIQDKSWYVYALIGLATHLSDEQRAIALADALRTALAIQDQSSRATMLGKLAPHLPDEQQTIALTDALRAAVAIQDKSSRAITLGRLAPLVPHLPDEQQAIALTYALHAAFAIPCLARRAQALKKLAPHLPNDLATQLLQAIFAMPNQLGRIQIVAALVPHLPDKQQVLVMSQMLKASASNYSNLVDTLEELAPHLPDELLPQTLEIVQSIQSEKWRTYALGWLAFRLPDEQQTIALADALQAAQDIQFGGPLYPSYPALNKLAPHLPDRLLAQTLRAVLSIPAESKRDRDYVLKRLAPRLPDWAHVEVELAYRSWQESLRMLSAYSSRPMFLGELRILMPFTLAVAGEDAEAVARGICLAIEEVGEWWP